MAFKRIMEQAEVDAGVARLSSGAKGRSFSLRSFHSLRHSFISALANSGVSSELRRRLSGHASEEMHALYTHHELETIRQAVSAIPRLPARGRSKMDIVTDNQRARRTRRWPAEPWKAPAVPLPSHQIEARA